MVDGKFKIGKPPPGMDMFGEMEWKKKAKQAKADWEAKNGGSAADDAPKAAAGGGGGGSRAAAPSGPEQYGGPVDGKWKNATASLLTHPPTHSTLTHTHHPSSQCLCLRLCVCAQVPDSIAGDMFAEMAWKKKQKAAKAEWEAANA